LSLCHSQAKTMHDTAIPLYSRISLNRNFPEYSLQRGDIANFVDTVPDPNSLEDGYILEIFNALGESIDVVTVPKSAVSALNPNELPSARSRNQTISRSAPSSEIANWRMFFGGAWQCHARTAGNWWVGRFYIIRQFRNAPSSTRKQGRESILYKTSG